MNNKGVSAVIGVILMVVLTVAITGTVYFYVSTMYKTDSELILIEGNITDKLIVGSPGYNTLGYWFIIDNGFEIEVDIETYYSFNIGDYYIEGGKE